MCSHKGGQVHKERQSLQAPPTLHKTQRPIVRLCSAGLWTLAPALLALAGSVQVLATPAAGEQSPQAAEQSPIRQQTGLDEALQAFEKDYRSPNSADPLLNLTSKHAQDLIKRLSALNGKLLAASRQYQGKISLSTYLHPVSLPTLKLERWKHILPAGVRPPQVSHQTFAVSLNGKAYVIAPGHGTHGDRRYFTPSKSDSAVRAATEEEARHAISLERRPSEFAGKIVTLEGKLLTGEIVRFEAAAVRGGALLQVLLPDVRPSFHSWKRGLEVDYARTLVFILPPEWSHAPGLRLHLASGFSGAPALEKTPDGDAVAGHFIGHRTVEAGGRKVTLGVIEDYEAIRSAVEEFAAQPRTDLRPSMLRSVPHP